MTLRLKLPRTLSPPYTSPDEGGEGVAVGAGPGSVQRGVGIGGDRGLDLLDDRVDLGAAEIHQEIGPAAEPVIVGSRAVDAQGRRAADVCPAGA